MKDLSVVIVNYNVQHFLRQTLLSLEEAARSLSTEIFVVDNASSDGSVEMIRHEFPSVKLIASKENLGFSKGNNIALKEATGKYILLLNPDTVLGENTLEACFSFMEANPSVGALGPRMIDGSGTFLPESKRGFPSPSVAFYKAFGLSKIFRNSSRFNRYHMGHVDSDTQVPVDVLAGAFMFIRYEVLSQIGLLDERFFMYGEDIDLSYRIKQAGFENYYFPKAQIIHFKGESTKKGSLNYVRVFYQAMILFADKHFKGKKASSFIGLMKFGIGLRALVDVVKGVSFKILLPLFDFLFIFLGLYLFKEFWEVYYFDNPEHFDGTNIYYFMLIYTLVWMSGAYIFGGYQRRFKFTTVLQGILLVSLIQLAIYGLLNPHYRPSRMMLVLGTVWALIVFLANRLIPHFLQYGNLDFGKDQKKNIIIVAGDSEFQRILHLLDSAGVDFNLLYHLLPGKDADMKWLAPVRSLIRMLRVDEIIWALNDVPRLVMIDFMSKEGEGISHKMVEKNSKVILGSQSKDEQGEWYAHQERFALDNPVAQRLKRMFDVSMAVLFLIFSPLLLLCQGNRWGLIKHIIEVFGGKTWVGYYNDGEHIDPLPRLRQSILPPVYSRVSANVQMRTIANYQYAKHYSILLDLGILMKNICHLGI